MKRYAFIFSLAALIFSVAGTANAQVFSSSRSTVYAGPGVYSSQRSSVYVGGNRGGVFVGGGHRGGFDISVQTRDFGFHIGNGPDWRHRGPVYRGPVYRGPVYRGPVYRGPVYRQPPVIIYRDRGYYDDYRYRSQPQTITVTVWEEYQDGYGGYVSRPRTVVAWYDYNSGGYVYRDLYGRLRRY